MNTDGTGFNTCKECHKTESLWNRTTTDHKEGEQLDDRRNVGESSCNCGDGTDQRVQSLMFVMAMTIAYIWQGPIHPKLKFWFFILSSLRQIPDMDIFVSKRYVELQVNLSRYRPVLFLRVPGGWGSQIAWQSAHAGGNVVTHTHRSPLPSRKYSWFSIMLETESNPGS